MNQPAAHTRPWETAETLLGLALLLSLILHFFFPLPLSAWVPRPVGLGVGVLLIFLGLALIRSARSQFRLAHQPTDPGQATTELITGGVYARSRNPLYVAALMVFYGLGALLNLFWMFLMGLILWLAITQFLILPEEKYLQAKFGERYTTYAHRVPRWLHWGK